MNTATPGHSYVYLSFAGPEGFRGACLVEANDQIEAVLISHSKKINPGGQVLMFGPMLYDDVAEDVRKYPIDTLLSEADLKNLGPIVSGKHVSDFLTNA